MYFLFHHVSTKANDFVHPFDVIFNTEVSFLIQWTKTNSNRVNEKEKIYHRKTVKLTKFDDSTCEVSICHYNDVIMGAMAHQIISLTIVYSIVYAGADQRKHQSSALLAFVWVHWWSVNSPHKWPVTQKMFPFDDVIMKWCHVVRVIHLRVHYYQGVI